MSRVGLNFSQAESYLSFLLHRGHLQTRLDSMGFKQYTLTLRGEQLRDSIAWIQVELDGLFTRTPPAGVPLANRVLSDSNAKKMGENAPQNANSHKTNTKVRTQT